MKKVAKCLLFASLFCNIGLLGVIGMIEHRYKPIYTMLEHRGLVKAAPQNRPDYWAIKGWENTVTKLHMDFDVAFFGNSITRGSDFQQEFSDLKIINLGYPGDNLKGMLHRINAVKGANPRKIFIMAGTNDLPRLDIDTYISQYETLLQTLADSVPHAKIYIQSVLPTNHSMTAKYTSNAKVIQANRELKKLSERMGCTFIDLYPLYTDEKGELRESFTIEGVHLKPEAYKPWSTAIRPYVYE